MHLHVHVQAWQDLLCIRDFTATVFQLMNCLSQCNLRTDKVTYLHVIPVHTLHVTHAPNFSCSWDCALHECVYKNVRVHNLCDYGFNRKILETTVQSHVL